MVGGLFSILRGATFSSAFAGDVELAETQRGGGEIELAIERWSEPRDLRAPGHGLGAVLFFRRLGENADRRRREPGSIAMHFARGLFCGIANRPRSRRSLACLSETGFAPARPAFVDRGESEKKPKTKPRTTKSEMSSGIANPRACG